MNDTTKSTTQRIRTIWAILLAGGLLATACASAVAHDTSALASSLETGHGPDYYWQELERRGYEVTAVNYDDSDYVEYEVVRDGDSYEVQIALDENRRATEIEVVSNAWLAEETVDALEPAAPAAENTDSDVDPGAAVVPGESDRVVTESYDRDRDATVAAGTALTVAVEGGITSETATVGQEVGFRVVEPVTVGHDVLVPTGSAFYGTVVLAEKAERPQKPGKLEIHITRLSVRGRLHDVEAAFVAKGKGSHQDDARDIGIGAAVGAIVGAIADGGKGALAGIVLGGGGVFLATKGEDVELPSGTRLQIELREPVTVPLDS